MQRVLSASMARNTVRPPGWNRASAATLAAKGSSQRSRRSQPPTGTRLQSATARSAIAATPCATHAPRGNSTTVTTKPSAAASLTAAEPEPTGPGEGARRREFRFSGGTQAFEAAQTVPRCPRVRRRASHHVSAKAASVPTPPAITVPHPWEARPGTRSSAAARAGQVVPPPDARTPILPPLSQAHRARDRQTAPQTRPDRSPRANPRPRTRGTSPGVLRSGRQQFRPRPGQAGKHQGGDDGLARPDEHVDERHGREGGAPGSGSRTSPVARRRRSRQRRWHTTPQTQPRTGARANRCPRDGRRCD